MNTDEYEDFITWKNNMKYNTSLAFFEKNHINNHDYKLWKYQNDIGCYDTNILIKMYSLEKRLDRVERTLDQVMED